MFWVIVLFKLPSQSHSALGQSAMIGHTMPWGSNEFVKRPSEFRAYRFASARLLVSVLLSYQHLQQHLYFILVYLACLKISTFRLRPQWMAEQLTPRRLWLRLWELIYTPWWTKWSLGWLGMRGAGELVTALTILRRWTQSRNIFLMQRWDWSSWGTQRAKLPLSSVGL